MFSVYIMAILNAQLFIRLPYEQYLWKIHAAYLGCLLLFVYCYLLTVMLNKRSSAKILFMPMLVYLLLFLYPPVMAYLNHGQPLVYGYLAVRHFVTIISALVVYVLLRHEVISIGDLADTFLAVAWTSLVFFLLLTRIIEPTMEAGKNDVTVSVHLGVRYMFNISFIVYGCIHYFQMMVFRLGVWNVFSFLSFLFYILFIYKGRTTLAVVLFLLLLVLLRGLKSRVRKTFNNSIIMFCIGCMAISGGLVLYGDNDFLINLEESFHSVWLSLNGELSEDDSANSRVFQTEIVMKYWRGGVERWLFGNGWMSHQYKDGYKGAFGYFYPSDTGLIGGTFVFGVVGMVMVFMVVLTCLRWSNKVVKVCDHPGVSVIRYYYLYYLIMSLSTIEILDRSYHIAMMYGFFAYLYNQLFIKKRPVYRICTEPMVQRRNTYAIKRCIG